MRCPSLKELPPAPAGKTGWPWTEESPQLPDRMSDGKPWPRIGIVTPNYNYEEFIEETIRSVLLQGYPDIEYIVIDDGSTDKSTEVIKRYEKWITHWCTQPNAGQVPTINRGLKQLTAQIWSFLNSDDIYFPGVFGRIAETFSSRPDIKWVTGHTVFGNSVSEGKTMEVMLPREPWQCLIRKSYTPQPSTFLKQEALARFGYLDASLNFSFDLEYWCRLFLGGWMPMIIPDSLSFSRLHPRSKSATSRFFATEDVIIAMRYLSAVPMDRWAEVFRLCDVLFNLELRSFVFEAFYLKGRAEALWKLAQSANQRPSLLMERATWGAIRMILLARRAHPAKK